MKNVLYLHGFGSNKDSYTGNTLKRLFPRFHWTLETFDLLDVYGTIRKLNEIVQVNDIDTIVSSSLGCIYNLFLKKDKRNNRIINKILINPCCFPSKEIPKIAKLPSEIIEQCRAIESNVYEYNRDNGCDNLFGIFSKSDELLHYHDFFVGQYGNFAQNGEKESSNCIWVEGKHSHLAEEVLLSSMNHAIDYFDNVSRQSIDNQSTEKKKIVYVDMDGTLVDWESGVKRLTGMERLKYDGFEDEVPGIFQRMDPIPGAIEAIYRLNLKYDVYILSTSPWGNLSAPSDKLRWIQTFFGEEKTSPLYKKLIISHHKELNRGDYLIDDRPMSNGTICFQGEVLHFGSEKFPDWSSVLDYLMSK